MAKSWAATVGDLKKSDGFGDAWVDKFGQRFLSAIQEMSSQKKAGGKQHLGFNDPANRKEKAVRRTAPMAPELTVIVPVYDKAQTVDELLRRVDATPYAKQVVVVDDGSTDGTAEELEKWEGDPQVEFLRVRIKEGTITMLSIGLTHEGTVRGPIPPTGNTNTRGYFQPEVRTFLKRWVAQGPTHHFALGVGHHAGTIAKIADVLDIESVIVTDSS